MANDKVVVRSESMQQCVKEYQNAMELVLDAVQLYVNSLQALGQDYTGVAAAAMSVKVVQLTNDITTAAGRCADAMSELQQTEQIFQQNEDTLQTQARNLEEGEKSPFGA